jgi:pyruvate,water dikinase
MALSINSDAQAGAALAIREAAEAEIESAFSQPENRWQQMLRRPVFQWVLRQTRDRVRDRENLRFERTRVFGRVRRIFVELGKHLHASHSIAAPQDIFCLEVEEVLGFIEGTATIRNLAELASLRRREYEKFAQLKPLPDRFSTNGPVALNENLDIERRDSTAHQENLDSQETRQGTGCCAGIVTGRARVVIEPRGAVLLSGEILVAPRTDPGWVTLFANASGLIVERGSLLSHSAIVAREMGLPAVVSLRDATSWLQNGDLIELDGKTGVVRRIERAGDRI